MRLTLSCLACALCIAGKAYAEGPPTHLPELGFVAGPSIAWGHAAGGNHLMLGGDLTGHVLFLWGSLGTRAAVDGPRFIAPYAEVGVWAFVNLGLGYSPTIHPQGVTHFVHGFLGAPLPIEFDDLRTLVGRPTVDNYGSDKGLVFEPYYRPCFRVAGQPGSTFHEVGVLLKLWLH